MHRHGPSHHCGSGFVGVGVFVGSSRRICRGAALNRPHLDGSASCARHPGWRERQRFAVRSTGPSHHVVVFGRPVGCARGYTNIHCRCPVLTLSTAGAYALFNVIVNAWVSTASVSSVWWKVLITTGLLGFVTVGMAIAREQNLSLKDRVDARVQLIAKAASIGVIAILALASLLAAVALGWHLDEVSGSFTLLGTGVVGGLLLTIIGLLYLPNIAVWSASFALGPGFLMGTGTQVAASTTQTGALPVFPLVPAIPANGTPPLAAAAVLLIPLVSAMVMGWFVARRTTQDSAEASAGWGAVSGVVAGVALAILAGISGGSLGGGRLSQVGPQVIPVAFFAIFTFGVVASASAWVVAQQRQRTAD